MMHRLQLAGLLLLILLLLGLGMNWAGLAGVFSDSVSGIRAQDETTYASSAANLARHGGWLTPKVLGRFYLVKPPLLIWLSGLSMKILGISRFALRLPILLAATLATLLLWVWSEATYGRWTAVLAILLIVANPLWHTFSRVCYTDMLLALAMIGALWAVDRDPGLSERRNILWFGAFLALGLMAKNVAGLLPLAVLSVTCLLTRRRLPVVPMLKSCAVTAAIVAPWHLYQLIAHPRWFWADYVQIQLLEFGLRPPVQPSPDGPVWFYLKRLLLTDPLLCLLALIALPFLVRAVRAGKHDAGLLLSWLLVTGLALLSFRYRNLPYLLYSVPPLCLAAAAYAPPAFGNRHKLAAVVLAAAFCIKVTFASQVWGLSYGAAAPVSSAQWLRWYADQRRANELIAVDSDDEFYAAALPIPKIHYCYLDPNELVRRYAPHYAYLGITVSAAQFQEIDRWEPQFLERLRQWGLPSAAPIATNIMAPSAADIVRLVGTHPHIDFYLRRDIVNQIPPDVRSTRRMVPLSADRSFLLAMDGSEDGHETRVSEVWSAPKDW
ncbi:MAG TPA: glycosyltransferase family 39 protein [Candidatus Acidoferrales bacterium]|jgi:4-amino-4-deoxy-L-arabinose transferase-like glycosyltransferase|nr:glycosyltransferase family 39 protein [Candidatus Acidoferrales bacterium]